VKDEFERVWNQVAQEMTVAKKSFADEGTTEENARADYRDIAARRVRLGLILSEVGTRNQINVTDDEVSRALLERVRQFPGQERKVYDYYRSNPQLLAELRAPIFEDKVIDYIVELAKITDKTVTPEELYADPDEDHAYSHDHERNHGHDHDQDHDHDHGPDHAHGHDHAHDHDHEHDQGPKKKKKK